MAGIRKFVKPRQARPNLGSEAVLRRTVIGRLLFQIDL
jgi:hypothetical protein